MRKSLKKFLTYLFVFLFFFAIFYYIQFSFPYLIKAEPSWYHIKYAWLIRTQGTEKTINNFPWLQHTILKENPGDLWFGYHILLLPFTFGDLISGAKLSAVFFASLVFLGFFWLLRKFTIKYAFFWTLSLFFASHYFSFRIILARPHVLSIFFSLLGIYFISQKKYLQVFLLSLFWALVNPHVFLIIGMGFLWVIIEYCKEKKIDRKILYLPPLGILSAFLIRPDFPNNLYLVYHQVFSVLFFSFTGAGLNIANELTRPFIFHSLQHNFFLFFSFTFLCVYLLLILIIEKKLKRIGTPQLFVFFLSFIFGIITTMRSERFVEYWTPFTILSTAFVLNSAILPKIPDIFKYFKSFKNYNLPPDPKYLEIYQKIYRVIRNTLLFLERKTVALGIKISFFLFLFYFTALQIILLSRPWSDPIYVKTYEEAAKWLRENTPPGSLIMNKPWHIFPPLFFYNHHNYYSAGMGPTFMYIKNPKLYWLWRHIPEDATICDREECPETKKELDDKMVYQILKEKFSADYLLFEIPEMPPRTLCPIKEREIEQKVFFKDFRETLQKSEFFEKVFKRGEIEVYKVK